MQGWVWPQMSKLVVSCTIGPAAKSRTAARCVGVSTAIVRPFFGSLVIVRVGKVTAVAPATRRIGPSSATRAVR